MPDGKKASLLCYQPAIYQDGHPLEISFFLIVVCRLQPNVDTRQKQLAAWCSLALTYCRHQKLYTLDVMEAQESPVFNNRKIKRILSKAQWKLSTTTLCMSRKILSDLLNPMAGKLSMEAIQVVFEELRKKGKVNQNGLFFFGCLSFLMTLCICGDQGIWNGWTRTSQDV